MDLALVVCVAGSSRGCAGGVVQTVSQTPDGLGRCLYCGGKTREATGDERAEYRERISAEAELRGRGRDRKGGSK